MMTKASALGLGFRGDVALDGDAAEAPISDSFGEFMYGLYRLVKLGKPYYRPLDHSASGEHNVNETIDASVFERWRRVPAYRPKNLSDWSDRHGVDISSLTRSVLANDPNTAVPD
jgi:hypothetical protein